MTHVWLRQRERDAHKSRYKETERVETVKENSGEKKKRLNSSSI